MLFRATITSILLCLAPQFWVQNAVAAEALAVVGGNPVSYEEFEQMVYSEARQTFYHGQAQSDEDRIKFRRDVAQKLVDRKLKLIEARRLGLEPDQEAVGQQLASYESSYGGTDRWEKEGQAMLSRLRIFHEEESLVEQMDALLGHVDAPSDQELREYYRENIDKFTEPEQLRLSAILLSVAPSGGTVAWDAARAEAQQIIAQIRAGQTFAEAATLHSDDPSSANGGDMGFMHAGSLSPEVQQAVGKLEPGQMDDTPVTVLEGIVIVRLDDRRPPTVHELDAVRDRAAALWSRDASTRASKTRMEALRASSTISLDEEYLSKIPD